MYGKEKFRYYFAYGCNTNRAGMRARCPCAEPVGTSYLEGYRLRFAGPCDDQAFLTIVKDKDERVPVAVWKVNADDEDALDLYEGYPELYEKKRISVQMENANGRTELITGFIYVMKKWSTAHYPTDAYLLECMKGYRNFGFDDSPIKKAIHECYNY